jgi:hypothetical protein
VSGPTTGPNSSQPRCWITPIRVTAAARSLGAESSSLDDGLRPSLGFRRCAWKRARDRVGRDSCIDGTASREPASTRIRACGEQEARRVWTGPRIPAGGGTVAVSG